MDPKRARPMTVKKLRELLEDMDDDMLVITGFTREGGRYFDVVDERWIVSGRAVHVPGTKCGEDHDFTQFIEKARDPNALYLA